MHLVQLHRLLSPLGPTLPNKKLEREGITFWQTGTLGENQKPFDCIWVRPGWYVAAGSVVEGVRVGPPECLLLVSNSLSTFKHC